MPTPDTLTPYADRAADVARWRPVGGASKHRLGRRIGQYALVLWAACTLNFLLPQLAPGDPVDYLFAGEANALSDADRAEIRKDFGIDGSIATQYMRYWNGLATGDLGTSLEHARPVSSVIASRLPWTLALVGTATVATAVLGSLAGAAAAWRRGTRADITAVITVLAVDAMPGFWIGLVLLSVFSVQLGWFPSFGAVPLGDFNSWWSWLTAVAHRLVLPVTTVTTATVGGVFLVARASMVCTLDEPYIVMAEAKGVRPGRIAFRHALRNALLPVTTRVFLSIGVLLSGAVVVETVFSYPGLGRLVYGAVIARDYPLLQGAFLLITVGVIVANLAADLVYPLLDPRIRRSTTVPSPP